MSHRVVEATGRWECNNRPATDGWDGFANRIRKLFHKPLIHHTVWEFIPDEGFDIGPGEEVEIRIPLPSEAFYQEDK